MFFQSLSQFWASKTPSERSVGMAPRRFYTALLGSAVLAGGALLCADTAMAEKWVDATGKFTIDAEYDGVEGSNLLLRKSDGTTVKVPIAKLSAESRQLAKQMYEAAKAGKSAPAATRPAAMPATSQPLASSGIQRPQADFAPTPPSVAPMAAFPENATLEQTVDFVMDQVLAGHPEALWAALPQELRTELDSQAVRDAMRPSIDDQKTLAAPIKRTVMLVCELAVKQKQYITNTPMLGAIPPQAKDMMLDVYDPAVGTIYELVNGLFDSELMVDHSISAWVGYYGPRIGGHLQGLIAKAPPGMIDGFRQSIQVKSTGPTTGVVTIPPPPGAGPNSTPQDIEMVQVQGRWLPADLAKMWQENQGGLAASFKQEYEANKAQMAQQQQQASFMIMAGTGLIEGGLRPLLNATSQEQFDAELNKAMATFQQLGAQFGGGMGGPPGGAPPAGF